jgi:hypothetical protein
MRTRRPKQQKDRSEFGFLRPARGAGWPRARRQGETVARPLEPSQLIPVRSLVSPIPPVVPSNGRAPEVDGEAHGHRRPAKVAEDLDLHAGLQAPSPPSRPAHAPSRGLLLLLLQQQLDALSDEGRGLLVPRERDQLPHEVPRRLIQAEGDHSRFLCHSLSSFARFHRGRHDRLVMDLDLIA